MVSRGTPMLTAGDEFGRSQGGNNNAYAQDNATTWINWGAVDGELLAFSGGHGAAAGAAGAGPRPAPDGRARGAAKRLLMQPG